MDRKKALQNLGMAKRAGKVVAGEAVTLDYIKKNKLSCVILASDTLKNTTKRIKDKSDYYHVRVIHDFSSEEINQAIGTNDRKVLGITDKNFTDMILKHLDI